MFRRLEGFKAKYKYILLVAIVFLSVLTVTLRGGVPEKTYTYSKILASSVRTTIISYSLNSTGGWSVKVHNTDGNSSFVSDGDTFQAVIIDLPYQYKPEGFWSIRWASVTYTLTSDSQLEYEMLLLSRKGRLHIDAQGPTFLSHREVFTDIYRLDAALNQEMSLSEQLTLLEPFLGNFSILIAKKGLESGGFLMFKLDSIELMSSSRNVRSEAVPSLEELTLVTIGVAVVVIVIPTILLSILGLRLEQPSHRLGRIFLLSLLLYGILVRLVLAPFTGHPYDMEVWTESTRLFYESGVIDIRLFPLPFTYYVLLFAYSPYALLRVFGFQDLTFLAHTSGMIESIFIKAPFMLSDGLVFFILLKLFRKLNEGKLDPSKRLAFALMYFLNPLAIYLSSVWGMYDSIAVALFLAGIYFGLLTKSPFLSGLSYAASGLTKAFGFLGLVPLSTDLARGRKALNLSAILGIILGISVLFYLPLLAGNRLEDLPEVVSQFFKGRAGFGSNPPYVASASYISYLSVLGFNVEPSSLTYLLIMLMIVISIRYAQCFKNSTTQARVELTLRYFAAAFLVSYLIFFRVYEQYYLWVIPILIAYSYVKRASGPGFVAFTLGITLVPPLLGTITAGAEYYYGIPLNLPADMAMLTVLVSTIVVFGLISIADLKGRLAFFNTDRGIAALEGPALWFSFSLAYYTYYKMLFLGSVWYPISIAIALTATAFLYTKLKVKRVDRGA